MELSYLGQRLAFEPVPLVFRNAVAENVFALKNNKTLLETLRHRRYSKLRSSVEAKYAAQLGWKLGEFLIWLKTNNDDSYKSFLNRYGDLIYCTFTITDSRYLNRRGLYLFAVGETLRYIGRCKDSFGKRINYGYGKIHPKNCYLDGQATNCHLNSLIAKHRDSQVELYVHPLDDEAEIECLERSLIATYGPPWNIALRSSQGT